MATNFILLINEHQRIAELIDIDTPYVENSRLLHRGAAHPHPRE